MNESGYFIDEPDETTFGEYLLFSTIVLCMAIGLVGNVISFLVFTRGKHCSSAVCSGYFQVLSVTDTLIILIPMMELAIETIGAPSVYDLNTFTCRFVYFCSQWLVQTSLWIVVTLTFVRTLLVCFPFKFSKVKSSKKTEYCICLGVMIILGVINLPLYFIPEHISFEGTFYIPIPERNETDPPSRHVVDVEYLRLINNGTVNGTRIMPMDYEEKYCDMFANEEIHFAGLTFAIDYLLTIFFVFTYVGPILLTMICNGILVTKLRRHLSEITGRVSRDVSARRHAETMAITRRVIAIGMFMCAVITPTAVLASIKAIGDVVSGGMGEVADEEADEDAVVPIVVVEDDARLLYNRAFDIANVLYYINFCLNCFLYAAFGQDYWKDIKLFSCCK